MNFIEKIKYKIHLKRLGNDGLFWEIQKLRRTGFAEKLLLALEEVDQREKKGKISKREGAHV